jgi:hypothetical protein
LKRKPRLDSWAYFRNTVYVFIVRQCTSFSDYISRFYILNTNVYKNSKEFASNLEIKIFPLLDFALISSFVNCQKCTEENHCQLCPGLCKYFLPIYCKNLHVPSLVLWRQSGSNIRACANIFLPIYCKNLHVPSLVLWRQSGSNIRGCANLLQKFPGSIPRSLQ